MKESIHSPGRTRNLVGLDDFMRFCLFNTNPVNILGEKIFGFLGMIGVLLAICPRKDTGVKKI
jgi:hypothetical protein